MIRANDEGRERVAALFSRFHNFDDSVVRQVAVYAGSSGEKAVVTLEARDFKTAGLGWKKVSLTVHDVREYRFSRDERDYAYVLSLGLKYDRFGEISFFDFGPTTDEPDCVEDYRLSNFYVAGRSFSWQVRPYPKAWLREGRHGQPLGSER